MLGFRPSIVALVSPLILSAIMFPLQFPFAALSVSVKIYIRRTFTWCFQMNICRGKCLRHACRQQFINSLRFAPGIKASLYFRAPSFYNQAPIHNFQSENIRLESDQKYFLRTSKWANQLTLNSCKFFSPFINMPPTDLPAPDQRGEQTCSLRVDLQVR